MASAAAQPEESAREEGAKEGEEGGSRRIPRADFIVRGRYLVVRTLGEGLLLLALRLVCDVLARCGAGGRG